jgi:hypothetical protein
MGFEPGWLIRELRHATRTTRINGRGSEVYDLLKEIFDRVGLPDDLKAHAAIIITEVERP